jgi:DNA-binding FadR family transcriptional regulator
LRAEEHWRPGLPALRDEFHVALAAQSKSPVLQLFIDILMRLTTRYALQSRTDSATEAIEAVDQMNVDHSEIVAAVTAGDSARAKTLSERHVEAVTAWLQQHHSRSGSRGSTPRRLDLDAPRGKLAEMLAATIGDDIATGGWQVGSVLGSEKALLERYSVSRAVFREAVRLLEYHSIAHMRRGPGGGLVIAEPAAQASIDTIALYLQYRNPSGDDLRCVRDAIEVDNVAKVVKRRGEAAVAAFLETSRASHRSAFEGSRQETAREMRAAAGEGEQFHVGLAQLAGNSLLDLFLGIVVELFRRHRSSTRQAPLTWAEALEVHRAHLRILDAVEAGDDSLARYRVRRHLDAAASWAL